MQIFSKQSSASHHLLVPHYAWSLGHYCGCWTVACLYYKQQNKGFQVKKCRWFHYMTCWGYTPEQGSPNRDWWAHNYGSPTREMKMTPAQKVTHKMSKFPHTSVYGQLILTIHRKNICNVNVVRIGQGKHQNKCEQASAMYSYNWIPNASGNVCKSSQQCTGKPPPPPLDETYIWL